MYFTAECSSSSVLQMREQAKAPARSIQELSEPGPYVGKLKAQSSLSARVGVHSWIELD